MLAYVFWHWPAIERGYQAAVIEFHRALAAHPPTGFRGSRVARVGPRPWLTVSSAYEDWYFVDDFAALGTLNDAAISGPRRAAHDAVAALPAGGTAALYGLLSGDVLRPRHASFRSKPAGVTYASYVAGVPAGVEVWQRKMVLGAAPEFCILSNEPLDGSASMEIVHPGVDESPTPRAP